MRAAASVTDVLADPIGAYFTGRSFVVWFQPRLAGAMVHGHFDPSDAAAIQQLMSTPVLEPGYDLLCDLGELEQLAPDGFAILSAFFAVHAGLLAGLRRLAVVRPGGLAGAGLAGLFYENVKPVMEAGLFADRAEALGWLGYPSNAPEHIQIDDVLASIHDVSPLRRRLREYLTEHVADAQVAAAAKALGTSERSLQRELTAVETTFRDELTRARVRAAEALLTVTETKIETIARELGFKSVPAFTAMFNRVVGETPQEFRQRRAVRRRA